jgi:outer membrane protein OmpA-like peptidoglycan-associated protein
MMKLLRRSLTVAVVCILLSGLSGQNAKAQSAANRISFGFDGGGNKYYGNFNDNQFWFSGDAFIRWNILDFLSFVASFNSGQLRYKVNEANIRSNPLYFGNFDPSNGLGVGQGSYPDPNDPTKLTNPPIAREEINVIRHNGWDFMLSVQPFPGQKFSPYFIGGLELLNWEPRNKNQYFPLPNNNAGKYSKNSVGEVAGVGFEMYLSDDVTFNGRGLIHLTNTDHLDDYSVADYPTLSSGSSAQDAFLTFAVGFSYYIFGTLDADGDGLSDSDEKNIYHTDPHNPDTDGDGLNDGEEVKVYHTDPLKADTDGDGLRDGEEIKTYKTDPLNPDTDGDGLSDGQEVKVYHTDPHNPDTDGDGLKDGEEVNQFHTDPTKVDSDGDGLGDGDEVHKYNTNPVNADTDADGLSDGDEVMKYKTNPLKPDTDGDGLTDGEEVNAYHTDPLKMDTDGDGLTDGEEVHTYRTNPTKADTDNDGLTDGDEVHRVHTDPLNPDTDGDGFKDGVDHCPLIAGVAPYGCPAPPKIGTIANFPGVLFIVNTDNFDLSQPGTMSNLNQIRALIDQCPNLAVQIEGHASGEGAAARNQQLSDMRAAKVRQWLIEQGINASKISGTVGYGSSRPFVPEPQPAHMVKRGKKMVMTGGATPEQVEAARKQNRRIAVKVVRSCD